MKEELLQQMKEELIEKKKEIKEYNKNVKRINELLKDPKVKEYIELMGLNGTKLELKQETDDEIIFSFYSKYLSKIKENETNRIYVYLGTYKYNDDITIITIEHTIKVDYDSPEAKYHLYQDLECRTTKVVYIEEQESFEKQNIIIYPNTHLRKKAYFQIQREFFAESIKNEQKSAKKLIIKKYRR